MLQTRCKGGHLNRPLQALLDIAHWHVSQSFPYVVNMKGSFLWGLGLWQPPMVCLELAIILQLQLICCSLVDAIDIGLGLGLGLGVGLGLGLRL